MHDDRQMDDIRIAALRARCETVRGQRAEILFPADEVLALLDDREMWKGRAEAAFMIGRKLAGRGDPEST